MSFKNIEDITATIRAVYTLSLNPYKEWLIAIFPFWYTLLYSFYTNPSITFMFDLWWHRLILIILPFSIILCIFVGYYILFFRNITLSDRNYFFNPTNIDEYLKLPKMILSENFVTRFSFKLKLYGKMPSKFQDSNNGQLVLLIRKANTIDVSIKPRKHLKQKSYNPYEDIFYLKQDYELHSSELSFRFFIQAAGAVDTTKLEIYMFCEKSLEMFLKDIKTNPKKLSKKLIHTEEFYLSK